MVTKEEAIEKHRSKKGKIEIVSKVPLDTQEDMSTYYTPGVAYVCTEIQNNPGQVFELTNKANTIAIVSDGTRILGLGDIGPEAGMPVMEGKAILFKKFGGVDAIPLCITKSTEDEILEFLKRIEPSFGGVNIEDIESPKSLRVVQRAADMLKIPVFHDDQQGTAVVTLAALLNALKLAGKDKTVKIILSGAGSAGIGISKLLSFAGFKNVIVLDSKGAIYKGRTDNMNEFKEDIASRTNPKSIMGDLEDVITGADVFIGTSGVPGSFKATLISKMAQKPIVFALTNPIPEIEYAQAKAGGAFIAATGRSDSPNQINNVLCFPGIMRGLLEVRATKVTESMLNSAVKALAKSVGKELSPEMIVPKASDKKQAFKAAQIIAAEVGTTAVEEGFALVKKSSQEIKDNTKILLKRYDKIEKKVSKI